MKAAIIGGGACGMMAALTASESPENEITIFERQARLGRKLLATGNGRCNLSNRNEGPAHYHCGSAGFADTVLRQFGAAQTLAYFARLGLVTVTEPSGRVYPFSDSANSVLDVLRLALESRENVHILCAQEVRTLQKRAAFTVVTADGSYTADRVILACGGIAGGRLGATGDGYALAAQLGHRRTKLYESLVPIRTDPAYPRALKGVRAQAAIRLSGASGEIARACGEVQFTEYGLSGPVIFDLSRSVSTAAAPLEIWLDLAPQLDLPELERMLLRRAETFPALTAENLLTGLLHNRLGRTVVRYAGFSLTQPLRTLAPSDLRAIAAAVKQLCLPVTGTRGMDAAQVTAGGLRTEEFDPVTLESRLVSGLFAAGELLDVDGDCGGYNLQWAWSSGHAAGLLRSREDRV